MSSEGSERMAEQQILEALKEGLFDNLPGRGKPIDLSVNPFEEPGMGAVNRLLQNNNVVPEWVLLEREIVATRNATLAIVEQWEARQTASGAIPDYKCARNDIREAYLVGMRRTNDLITKYNCAASFVYRAPVGFLIGNRLKDFDERYGTSD